MAQRTRRQAVVVSCCLKEAECWGLLVSTGSAVGYSGWCVENISGSGANRWKKGGVARDTPVCEGERVSLGIEEAV